jgi:hypothetical protein
MAFGSSGYYLGSEFGNSLYNFFKHLIPYEYMDYS